MARIAGVDLPREKRIEIGLTYIYGIGRTSSNEILSKAGVNIEYMYAAPSDKSSARMIIKTDDAVKAEEAIG